jgi:hypothetical protein
MGILSERVSAQEKKKEKVRQINLANIEFAAQIQLFYILTVVVKFSVV